MEESQVGPWQPIFSLLLHLSPIRQTPLPTGPSRVMES
jgi:hypothetical protein